MLILGDNKKPDPQVSTPVNRPTDSSSASSSSHWDNSTHSYQNLDVDPYLLRNDSAYRERDGGQSGSGSGSHPSERSPLLPPSYTDIHSPNPHSHSTHSSHPGRDSPPLSGTSKPPPENRKERGCSTTVKFGWKELFVILGLFLLVWGLASGKLLDALREARRRARGGSGGGGGGGGNGGDEHGSVPQPPGGDSGEGADGSEPNWKEDWGKNYPLNSTFETSPHHCNIFTPPIPLTNRASHPTYLSSHSIFTLPLHSPLLFFTTHASSQQVSGHIKIYDRKEWAMERWVPGLDLDGGDGGKDGERGDEVKVVVEAQWEKGRDGAWKGWHVCKAGDGKESSGVILSNEYLPEPHWSPSISFNVYFIFPTVKSGKTIDLNTLRLRGLNMGIEIGEVVKAVTWKKIDWETSNGSVRGHVLAADKIDITSSNAAVVFEDVATIQPLNIRTTNGKIHVNTCSTKSQPNIVEYHTSNAAISGNVCARKQILLKTTSGALEVNCDAPSIDARTTNDHIQGQFKGLKGISNYANGLWLETSNGRVDVGILVAEDDNGKSGGGSREIDVLPLTVKSSNAAMDISINSLPITSQLEATISTSNSKITFHGSSNFQGDFRASSSSYAPIVVDVSPPSEKAKQRDIDITYSKNGYAAGSIYRRGEVKGEKGVSWGRLEISTTNSGLYARI